MGSFLSSAVVVDGVLYIGSTDGNLYAINVPKSLYFMGGMYLLALVIYVIAKIYRRSQGIDLKAIYTEIPVE